MSSARKVWAPYANGEYVLAVVDDLGDQLLLKRPGSDGGTVTVASALCYPSDRAPHTIEEIR